MFRYAPWARTMVDPLDRAHTQSEIDEAAPWLGTAGGMLESQMRIIQKRLGWTPVPMMPMMPDEGATLKAVVAASPVVEGQGGCAGLHGATSEPDVGSMAPPEAPITLAQAGSVMMAKIQQEAPELNVPTVKELKAIRFRKMVHVFNKMDPFRPLYRRVSEVRKKRQRWAIDAAFRNKMAMGRGCALVSKEVFDFVWQPETSDLGELPQGHTWSPSDAEVADMTAVEIFAQLNPESGAADVTGDSNIDEYNLRRCIT